MRVQFLVTYNGSPVKGATIVPILPLTTGPPLFAPVMPTTDEKGEWLGVVPLGISPAMYLMDVVVQGRGKQVRINGVFDEVENTFMVDLASGRVQRQRLTERIPGDGFWTVEPGLLNERDLIDVSDDPFVRSLSRCANCIYFFPVGAPSGSCLVNGSLTEPIPIRDAYNTTSRFYWPFFLPTPSPQRAARDISRLLGVNSGNG